MNLAPAEEQVLLRDSFERFFRNESTPARVRAAEPLGFDAALWAGLVQMGAPVMRVPDSAGGGGMGLFDAILAATEAGRSLASCPLVEVIVAARVLAEIGGAVGRDWVERIGRGEALVTLALHATVPGEPQMVPGGAVADAVLGLEGDTLVLIVGRSPGPPEVNLGAGSLSREILSPPARGTCVMLGEGETARRTYLAALEEWKLLTAAMLVGLSQQALAMAASYSRDRVQFGRPIGSFQGVAHPLADSATDIDGAELLVWRAVWAIARGRDDAAASVSMAWWWAGQAAARAVTRALRTFGGYGLSLEYDIQLYFRRGKAWALLNGDPAQELARIGDRLWASGNEPIPLPDAGAVAIEFGYGVEAERFAEQAREFFRANLTDALRAKAHHSTDGHDPEFHRRLASAGLLFPDWPVAHGGDARGPYEVSALGVVFEEFGWTRVPIGITNMGARMAMQFGSEALKREALPRFAAGEALSCLGFSEPGAGSDVYATVARATLDGEDWVIDGQKIFTTGAHLADYVLLLTRSDPEAAKHRGLTLFLAPMDLPGIEVRPVYTLQDERTNIVYFADVRVPDRYRLGEPGGGIAVMAAAMSLEHSGEGYHVSQLSMFAAALDWARRPPAPGASPPIESAATRSRLARVAVHTEIANLLCRRAVWAAAENHASRAFGAMSKLFATETYMHDAEALLALAAPDSLFAGRDPLGRLELKHRHAIANTIYGGTSEIHRSVIAEQGLGMPRTRS